MGVKALNSLRSWFFRESKSLVCLRVVFLTRV